MGPDVELSKISLDSLEAASEILFLRGVEKIIDRSGQLDETNNTPESQKLGIVLGGLTANYFVRRRS